MLWVRKSMWTECMCSDGCLLRQGQMRIFDRSFVSLSWIPASLLFKLDTTWSVLEFQKRIWWRAVWNKYEISKLNLKGFAQALREVTSAHQEDSISRWHHRAQWNACVCKCMNDDWHHLIRDKNCYFDKTYVHAHAKALLLWSQTSFI